jgi:hypothetical protein
LSPHAKSISKYQSFQKISEQEGQEAGSVVGFGGGMRPLQNHFPPPRLPVDPIERNFAHLLISIRAQQIRDD